MHQPTFSRLEAEQDRYVTRRQKFLDQLDALVPWEKLEAAIEPHYYPKRGRGRRPYPLAVMLRIHIVQLSYNLSDPGTEDLLHEARSARDFCGLNLGEPIPDETTILTFRHRLERHALGSAVLHVINEHLASKGVRLSGGSIVDATIVSAPSSTQNRARARDPEMHQTKKGNQWYFGMKVHIGMDRDSGLVHSFTTTPANVSDVSEAHRLLHGEEVEVYGDAGYRGVEKRPENAACGVDRWNVAMRPGLRRWLDPTSAEAAEEKRKASVRARVEHPFYTLKVRFDYAKVRYRGLAKNRERFGVLLGLNNLLVAKLPCA